jgi:hypothetical protein
MLCLLAAPAFAQPADEFEQAAKAAAVKEELAKLDSQYLDMAKKAMRDPTGAKWDSLRILYIQSTYFRQAGPALWSRMETAGRKAMKTNTQGDIAAFDELLKQQYGNFQSHVLAVKLAGAGAAFIDIGQEQAALDAISETIIAKNDGKSKEKAFVVMMPTEINLIVETYFGYQLAGVRRVAEGGHTYDVANWRNKDNGKTGSIWFNSDIIVDNK